jgi:hypothetical protein
VSIDIVRLPVRLHLLKLHPNEHCYSATKKTASVNVAANDISAAAYVAITTANSAADYAVKIFTAPTTVLLLLRSAADAIAAIDTAFATIISSEAALPDALNGVLLLLLVSFGTLQFFTFVMTYVLVLQVRSL